MVGVVAILVAAASILPTHNTFAASHTGHDVAVTDCLFAGDTGCDGHLADRNCSAHSGCIFTGVLAAGPALAVSPGRDWIFAARAIVSGWADFPAKPPPISIA